MDNELKQYLSEMETRLGDRIEAAKVEMTEKMRDMQTELLKGFQAYSGPATLRMRKIEADQSNLDAAMSGRMDFMEQRLGQIEQRLGMIPPQ